MKGYKAWRNFREFLFYDVGCISWETAASAVMIVSATTCGCDIMITWEPSTSVIVAPARSAIERTASVPITLSPLATTVQDGSFFQAGTPVGSSNGNAERGRWVAAIKEVCSAGRSAAKTSWKSAGSILNSTAVSAPSPVGYWSGLKVGLMTLSSDLLAISARVSPSSGAKAAT